MLIVEFCQYGWTPLIYSARYNQQKLLMLLLQNDADVDAITVVCLLLRLNLCYKAFIQPHRMVELL